MMYNTAMATRPSKEKLTVVVFGSTLSSAAAANRHLPTPVLEAGGGEGKKKRLGKTHIIHVHYPRLELCSYLS